MSSQMVSPSGYLNGYSHVPVSTSQPFTYRDTDTMLDNIYRIRGFIKNLTNVVNAFIDAYNDYATQNDTDKANIDQQITDILSEINDLQTALAKFENTSITYNPTKGKYEDSKQTNRDLFRELAVFGERVNQMATLTTAQMAQHGCEETAVIGNLTIQGDAVPRVTPITGGNQS